MINKSRIEKIKFTVTQNFSASAFNKAFFPLSSQTFFLFKLNSLPPALGKEFLPAIGNVSFLCSYMHIRVYYSEERDSPGISTITIFSSELSLALLNIQSAF